MKKLITICLIMATVFTVNAQDRKPTKEETISFMKRVLESTVGYVAPSKGQLLEVKFDGVSYFYKSYYDLLKSNIYGTTSAINWELLNAESFKSFENNSLVQLKVNFTGNFSFRQKIGLREEKEFFYSEVIFYLPLANVESFKKACIRLSEIAKEENKDPFQN